jgi:hypothetical protein
MFGMVLGLRTYLELAAGAVLIVGFLVFASHEREVGREQVMAADAKVVALQAQLNEQKDKDAQAIVDASTAVFKNMSSQPVPAPKLVRLCVDSLSGGPSGANGGAISKPDDAAALQVTVERPGASTGFDIRPITEHLLDTADSQITALQSYINACIKEGFCKPIVPDSTSVVPASSATTALGTAETALASSALSTLHARGGPPTLDP